jgi:hypothetical protein
MQQSASCKTISWYNKPSVLLLSITGCGTTRHILLANSGLLAYLSPIDHLVEVQ